MQAAPKRRATPHNAIKNKLHKFSFGRFTRLGKILNNYSLIYSIHSTRQACASSSSDAALFST